MNPQVETLAFALNEMTSEDLTTLTCWKANLRIEAEEHLRNATAWFKYLAYAFVPDTEDIWVRFKTFSDHRSYLFSLAYDNRLPQGIYSGLLHAIDYRAMAEWILNGDRYDR